MNTCNNTRSLIPDYLVLLGKRGLTVSKIKLTLLLMLAKFMRRGKDELVWI